jgi:LysR family transcriptional regulator, transcriptional activator of nhaA
MKELNHHHLHYFWVVAREGTITAAAEVLGVTAPTVSMQVSALERDLGVPLFERRGSRLEITEAGRTVQRLASDIFALSRDLLDAVATGGQSRSSRFAVGISDSLPLLSAHRLLEPALALPPEEVRVILRADKSAPLLGALTARTLDLVLTDTPGSPTDPVHTKTHLLQESDVLLFGTPELVARFAPGFPGSLQGAPFVLHTESTPLRRGLDGWFARMGIRPMVTAEVEEVGLLQLLGQQGRGLFAAPALVSDLIQARYGVEVAGRAEGVSERFFALTLEGQPPNRGAQALLDRWRPSPSGGE